MKKSYTKPEMLEVRFDARDLICTSIEMAFDPAIENDEFDNL